MLVPKNYNYFPIIQRKPYANFYLILTELNASRNNESFQSRLSPNIRRPIQNGIRKIVVTYFGKKILVQKDEFGKVIDARLENRNIRPTPGNPMQSATASVNGMILIVHFDHFGAIRGVSVPPHNILK